jgi:hypothetical protein
MADRIQEQATNEFPTIGEPKQQDDPGFATRRRLVKGTALALPAIMTLRSGAALAATSMVCRESEALADPELKTASPDEWMRVEEEESYNLVYVDENGGIHTAQGYDGQPMTYSCYTSIYGTPQEIQRSTSLEVESTTPQQGTSTMMLESEKTTELSGTSKNPKNPWQNPW